MLTVTARATARRGRRRRLRLPRPPRAAATRGAIPYDFFVGRPGLAADNGRRAQDRADRRHAQGHEPGVRLPLAGRAVRPARELHRPGDGREGQGAPLRDDADEERRQLRRLRSSRSRRARSSTRGCSAGRTRTPSRATRARPVNVNGIMVDYRADIGAAGAVFASPGRYYFSVDSQSDPVTGKSLAGSYVLRSWVNDLKPPKVTLLTTRVAAGRPTIALRVDRLAVRRRPVLRRLRLRAATRRRGGVRPADRHGPDPAPLDALRSSAPATRRCCCSPPTTRSRRT